MKSWRWVHYDPDGVPSTALMDLATALNRLAYFGHPSPKSALLTLFCGDTIQAEADCFWEKSQTGDNFRLQETNFIIQPSRWICLRDSLIRRESKDPEAYVTLEKLDCENELAAEWEPEYNRFSYKLRPDNLSPFDDGYFEEVFRAQNISIRPLATLGPAGEIIGIADEAESSGIEVTDDNRPPRGRRPKYDWLDACLTIFGKIYRGDLKIKQQADIERALIDHLSGENDGPAESTVRPYANKIWKEYDVG